MRLFQGYKIIQKSKIIILPSATIIVAVEEPLLIVVIQKSQSNVHICSRLSLSLHLIDVHFIANLILQDFPPEAATNWLAELLDMLPQCIHLIFEEAKWNKSRGRDGAVIADNMNWVMVGGDRFPPL